MAGKEVPIVIIVEDDPYGLSFMESSIRRAGYEPAGAGTSEEARSLLDRFGMDRVFAIVSDYQLPDETGTEFLKWVSSQDRNLATIIVTAQGEKSVVQETLAAGALDYLEKPLTHRTLANCVQRAIEHTRRFRKYEEDQRGLKNLELLDTLLNGRVDETLTEGFSIFYHPLHEVGGDFFHLLRREGGGVVLLAGDVSGHDFGSGFVSTYFHGMFGGSMAAGASVESTLELFNGNLTGPTRIQSPEASPFSLSLAIFEFEPDWSACRHWNFGFSPAEVITEKGFVIQGHYGRPPLGWLETINVTPERIAFSGNDWLYIYTDGLMDYAEELEIDKFALMRILLNANGSIDEMPIEPKDDILVIRYKVKADTLIEEVFEPVLSEQYAGSEISHIDHLQSVWRRSIVFALQDQLGDRLYELLICLREGMINALTHGCNNSPEKFTQLQISFHPTHRKVRVRIDDPGKGHEFDLVTRVREMENGAGAHMGLGIIQHLSDDFDIQNKGTSLIFDFYINPEDTPKP